MKFAILSDIHGNIFALEECFKYIDKMNVDGIIWCGDYITDVPRAHEVISFIKSSMKKYKTYIVRGNREDYIIEHHKFNNIEWSMENRNGPFLCCYNELSNEDMEFILNLPESLVIDIPNMPKIFVSHKENLEDELDCKYRISGHTHEQISFVKDNVKYINPGSAGFPFGTVGAQFSILDIDSNCEKVEHYQIQYDMNKTIEAIENSYLPKTVIEWDKNLIEILKTGVNCTTIYIEEVLRIAREKGLEADDLDKVPIEIWHEARKNIDFMS